MICVLRVIAGPAVGAKCGLTHGQRLTIGRVSSSDFSVAADIHMSRHHLIVEGLDSAFRIRDVGSSNGTFVNDSRISVVELCDGDCIKAGISIFQVFLEQDAGTHSPTVVDVDELNAFIPHRPLRAGGADGHRENNTERYGPDV